MSTGKDLLRKRFSSDPDKFYRVSLFDDMGFVRRRCPKCGGFFWTLDSERETCPEQPCQQYDFLGTPPTRSKTDYTAAWRKVESFFKKNGHQSIHRYPVVCRWRPDLFFTIASIVDFQRIESGKVVFEFPFNPLIVPQMCLRFSDIENVGITGRHYTSFCMIGQHSLANENGYWKDRCVELDFRLLTEEFGIDKKEVVFKEDAWLGPGAFGNSLEYYVRGLELGNAVFTGFEGTPENYKEYTVKVIDMGAGLERFVWLSQGTFNSYDAVFAPVLKRLRETAGISEVESSLNNYFRLAGSLDFENLGTGTDQYALLARKLGFSESELRSKLKKIQAIYSVIDHARTLLFGISDGMLPSNVGGGYNLRVLMRRSLDFIQELGIDIDLKDLVLWHAESLVDLYPELLEGISDVGTILAAEQSKFALSKVRASKIIETLTRKNQILSNDKLIELYDSDGITPDEVRRSGVQVNIPDDFYARITSRHMVHREEENRDTNQRKELNLDSLRPTRLLFYEDSNLDRFKAKVLLSLPNNLLILDSTAFYARAGGQEPDRGTIAGIEVDDVIKINNIVIHHFKGKGAFFQGQEVECSVDFKRRSLITRHHTATHIINGASRKVLGRWVWQHSAFKDVDMARLDITHFAHLSREQIIEIENLANEIVRKDLPVTISWLPRVEAEERYGFRLYQGGAAPVKDLRVVNIQGFDVEACGGTHVSSTGQIGLIKIIKSERIQDGVERLEFVAGEVALKYIENQETILTESAVRLETPIEKLGASISNLKQEIETSRKNARQLAKRLADAMVGAIPGQSKKLGPIRVYFSLFEEGLDAEYHLTMGDRITRLNADLVYIALIFDNSKTRILVFSGDVAQKSGAIASLIAKEIARSLAGSGGGDARFGQGGAGGKPDVLPDFERILSDNILRKNDQSLTSNI